MEQGFKAWADSFDYWIRKGVSKFRRATYRTFNWTVWNLDQNVTIRYRCSPEYNEIELQANVCGDFNSCTRIPCGTSEEDCLDIVRDNIMRALWQRYDLKDPKEIW